MTDKKDDPAKPAATPAAAAAKPVDPKRPHATLDLKAIEVKTGRPADTPPAQAAKPTDPDPAKDAMKAAEAAKTVAGAAASAAKTPPGTNTKPAEKPADIANKSATAAKPAPAPQPRSGGGIGSAISHMLAGIIGGGLAWYGASTLIPQYGAQLGLPMPPADTKAADATASKIAALEKAIAEKFPVPQGDVAGKLAAAQAQIAKLEASAKTVTDLAAAQTKLAADTKTLSDTLAKSTSGSEGADGRIAKLEERLKLMSDAAIGDPQAGKLPQIAGLSGRVVDLEANLQNQLSALRKTVTQELESRLSVTNETSEAAKSGASRLDREVAAVKSEAAATGQKLSTLRADADRLTSAVQGIRDDSNGLKTALDAVKSDVDARFKATAKPADVAQALAPVAGKLTNLEQSVQTVVKGEEDRKTNAERIVLALELGNLKRAVDRGQKYATELADVKKASGGKIDLSVLETYKDTGIATLADLARDFRDVASRAVDASSQPKDASVMDRILSGAKSVIAVRKITYAPDDKSTEAILGRMDGALRDGRSSDVIEEAKALPPESGKAVQDWLARVKARAAVDGAIGGLEAQLKSSLTGSPAPAGPAK
jgi:hypothetical protein